MPVILDAMGSDDRPEPEIHAAIDWVRQKNEEIYLVGDEPMLKSQLDGLGAASLPIRIVHAPEAIDMSDHIEDVRKKKNNSMRIGMDFVKDGKADAFVTAGNTGMVMYFAMKAFGPIEGVHRPALTALFPVKNGKCVVCDIGANAECRPEFLVQFAQMGSIYAQKMLGITNPRIGLLANGEEAGKGNELVKGTYPLLATSGLNFIGNVEGKELFAGMADVVVTDGFTGNILLKSSEAVSKLLVELLKEYLLSSWRTKIGALLAKPAFNRLKILMDPAEIGAAPLLGIDSLVFVGHGRSDARAMFSAIRAGSDAVHSQLLPALRAAIQQNLT